MGLLLSVIAPVSGGDGWSVAVPVEVRALQGDAVLLPCSFSHPPHAQHAALRLLWLRGHGPDATVLLRCSCCGSGASACEPGPRRDRRYRLEGNPREHDLSMRISGAALQDSGRYYCRLEVMGRDPVSLQDEMGTRLRVEAPPRILLPPGSSEILSFFTLVSSGSSPAPPRILSLLHPSPPRILSPSFPLVSSGPRILSFSFTLVSSILPSSSRDPVPVQGPPAGRPSGPPDDLWAGSARSGGSLPVRSQLSVVEPGRRYTCSASNPLGKEQAACTSCPLPLPGGGASPLLLLLFLSLGLKLLLLGTGLWTLQAACWAIIA
ncbi:sialic acid-binding Ig-like lectin 15 [Pseudoliparis swirei]|uniref:sialic acid-binding Ig-like lectin 15 n=1 Tax=Pseudoliparis swirei TaxID=2059687 RepID=UPI0024BE179C|nr:sialic acid-binding Ig-like lectin 15 [Pseudoliparis swirei]